jgi:hypothetical protein
MTVVGKILVNQSPRSGFYDCHVERFAILGPLPSVMMSVVSEDAERPDMGYCELVKDNGETILVEAFGWTPTNGHLLVKARMVPMMTAEVW